MICDMDVAPGSVLITASVAESPDEAALTFGAWTFPVPLLLRRTAPALRDGHGHGWLESWRRKEGQHGVSRILLRGETAQAPHWSAGLSAWALRRSD